ncbi:hypothetical protein CL2_25920 [Anaerostipes hadrus]|uniref:Uncharacterized protein n=1 Tax=Anaerostipes hadrus TaxID=649756 RepID=D4MVK6_ANAHA|nr:hypothetical protein CL2_25920 [Anaerostipes hadrus]
MQVICQRNFNVILTRKEGETLTEQEIRDIGIRCALRHMDSLRIQAAEGKKADFTEPCKNCPDIESCNCDCSITTKKIADEAGYNVDLVGGTIKLYRMKSMSVIVDEDENGISLDIKTKYPVKLREPRRLIRTLYKVRLKLAKKIIRKEKEKAKKENKEEEFKNLVQQTINIMNVCGNLVLVQDEGKILKFVCSGLIGSEEEFFENIKRELSEAISES